MADMGPGLRGCQEILRTNKSVVPAQAGTQKQGTEIPGFPLSRRFRGNDEQGMLGVGLRDWITASFAGMTINLLIFYIHL